MSLEYNPNNVNGWGNPNIFENIHYLEGRMTWCWNAGAEFIYYLR